MSEWALEIKDFRFHYPDSNRDILRIAGWKVRRGRKICVVGPRGSGKSTLIELLTGNIQPKEGEVRVLDQNLAQMTPSERRRWCRARCSVVFNKGNFFSYLSLSENMKLYCHQKDVPWNETRAKSLLDRFRLGDFFVKRPRELTLGQRQWAALAQTFLAKPELVFAECADLHLDESERSVFFKGLTDFCQESAATLICCDLSLDPTKSFDESMTLLELQGGHR